MLRLTASTLGAAALVAALAGCGDSDAGSLPEFSGTSAPATTAAPPASASSPAAVRSNGVFEDAVGVEAGSIRAKGDGRAVAQVWVSYWRERTEAFHDVDASRPELTAVAAGSALEQVQGYVETLRAGGHHTIGTAVVNVSKIALGGGKATITSCLDNRTIDVDAKLRPVETPTPQYLIRGTAVRAGSSWKISDAVVVRKGTC